jgi:hypothetical protein
VVFENLGVPDVAPERFDALRRRRNDFEKMGGLESGEDGISPIPCAGMENGKITRLKCPFRKFFL